MPSLTLGLAARAPGRPVERIACRMGQTQIGKILAHAKRETQLLKVALVFVGDAMEENPDALSQDAAKLGHLGVPAFMFQDGNARDVEHVFREIARLTRGTHCRFDPGAARQLAELLRAVAVYAAGGMAVLASRGDRPKPRRKGNCGNSIIARLRNSGGDVTPAEERRLAVRASRACSCQ
jgi:hypothetical protein